MTDYKLIKFKDNELELDVNVSPEEDTVWLTKDEIALLFERDRTVISKHINNIYKEEELEEKSTCAKNAQVQLEGKRKIVRTHKFYNLDVIISVGYRVKSKRGIIFRKWANSVLKQFLIKGYVLDANRVLISKENYLRLENDVAHIKREIDEIKIKTFIEPMKEKLFYDGQYFDAYDFLISIIQKAAKEILLIDPYCDYKALEILSHANESASISICISNKSKLLMNDISVFEKQYTKLSIIKDDTIHDRFLVLDNSLCYSLGTSINYIGKKTFVITKIEDETIVKAIINRTKNKKYSQL